MECYELCKLIRKVIVNSAAEVVSYESWGGDFCASQIRDTVERVKRIDGFHPIDLSILTALEMDDLGFGIWSDENPIRLIPLWLLPYLPDEFECESICGEKAVVRKAEIDNDNRFGCLAYGVNPAQQ